MVAVTQETFLAALKDAMRGQIELALEAEVEAACEQLRKRLRGETAKIALQIMSHYETYQREDRLVIEVRNAPKS